jgi:hypothetical protein
MHVAGPDAGALISSAVPASAMVSAISVTNAGTHAGNPLCAWV